MFDPSAIEPRPYPKLELRNLKLIEGIREFTRGKFARKTRGWEGEAPAEPLDVQKTVGSPGALPSQFYCLLTATLFVLLIGSSTRADDWPTFRHDNRRSGRTIEKLRVENLRQQWVYRSTHPPQPAWPGPAKWDAYKNIRGLSSMRGYDPVFHVVIAGQSLYFGSSADDSVHCLDTVTGREKWSFFTDGPVRVAPTLADGRVFFGSDDGHAYCLRAEAGTLIWKFGQPTDGADSPRSARRRILNNGRFIAYSPCRTGVLVDRETAYFALALLPWREAYLCAVDAKSGKPDGTSRYVKKLFGATLEGTMLASPERIVAPRGRIEPLVFDRAAGRPIGGLEGGGGSFVLFADDERILHGPGNKTGWITESSLQTRKKVETYADRTAAVVAGESLVLLSNNKLTAMHRPTRKINWDVECQFPHDVIVAGDAIIVGGEDQVAAFDVKTGKRLWTGRVNGRAYGLAVANGGLFVSTDEGAIHCFRPGDRPTSRAGKSKTVTKASPKSANERFRPVEIRDSGLVSRWVFRSGMETAARRRGLKNAARRVADLAGQLPATIMGDIQLREAGGVQALVLDGGTNSVMIAEDHNKAGLPAKRISVEAWVRVDQPQTWGGIIGAIQDNGSYERGWILGYNGSKFSFAVAGKQGPGNLTYLTARKEFQKGVWYHVMGTYDGAVQTIYVNGKLENTANAQKGEINYPPQAFYEIGAYHDKDEYFRMTGMLHEVRVYKRVLTAKEAEDHFEAKKAMFPVPTHLETGPFAQFISPTSAVVRWQTAKPSPTILDYVSDGERNRIIDATLKTDHRAVIPKLKRNSIASYSIQTLTNGQRKTTSTFELDTHFNYSLPLVPDRPNPFAKDQADDLYATAVDRILSKTGVDRLDKGICLVLGCGEGRLMYELARRTKLRVVGVDTDSRSVAAARKALMRAGMYGTRTAVHQVDSCARLPFVGHFANLIVSERMLADGTFAGSAAELLRVLRPNGGIAYLGQPAGAKKKLSRTKLQAWFDAGSVRFQFDETQDGLWAKFRRGPLPGAGDWSHLYGRADNSAFGGEALGGATTTSELQVQWIGRPGPRAQPDRNGRKPSPLSTNGRLFVQGLHRLIAVDAFNGTILWSLEIPHLERFNMPRDCSNWCADDDHVFVAIKDKCWQIDAQTGDVVKFHRVIPGGRNDWQYDWSYLARQDDLLLASAVKRGTAFTDFWGTAAAGWYDARSGPVTFKVCSENLFALNASTGKRVWTYSNGVIINSTLTAAAGRVYFVECRNSKVKASSSRRVGMSELWQDQYLVALDLKTGKSIWQKPIDTADGTVVFYMAHGNDRLVIASSNSKKYDVYAFEATSGRSLWHRDFGWLEGKGDHGKAMSRPAIVGNKVYVRPSVLDLPTGKLLSLRMPAGGCGTYAATKNAFIFRSSKITLWNTSSGSSTNWDRLRPGCWLSTIPANGMLLSPEAGGGCSCGSWMETSIGFIPSR